MPFRPSGREQTFTTSLVKGFTGEVHLTQERNLYQKATVNQFTSEVNRPSLPSPVNVEVHFLHCSWEQWRKWTSRFTSEGSEGLFTILPHCVTIVTSSSELTNDRRAWMRYWRKWLLCQLYHNLFSARAVDLPKNSRFPAELRWSEKCKIIDQR